MKLGSEVASNISARRSHPPSGWVAGETGSCADLAVDTFYRDAQQNGVDNANDASILHALGLIQ
jgi:hypothetical protein